MKLTHMLTSSPSAAEGKGGGEKEGKDNTGSEARQA